MKGFIRRVFRYLLRGTPVYNIEVRQGIFKDDNRFQGRHALVTGGSKGIGFAVAEKIVAGGGTVVITGRNQETLEKAQAKLGERCRAISFDASRMQGEELLKQAEAQFGVIDTLVCNAGISLHERDFLSVTESDWDKQMSVNLKSVYFLCQSYVKYYQEKQLQQGHIIIMASETAGQPSYRPYSITKTASVFFMKWLAQNYIASGLRVNAVAPGVTGTDMTRCSGSGTAIRENAPGKRVLSPVEVGEVCAFLLSDAASGIAGQIIACNEAAVCFNNGVALDGCAESE